MFIRGKFVTNSSSSAFLCYGFEFRKKADFARRAWEAGIMRETDKESFVERYGTRNYTNNRTKKTISEPLDLTNENDRDEFFEILADCRDVEDLLGTWSGYFDYNSTTEMVCPRECNFYAGEGDVRELNFPSPEQMTDINAQLEAFLHLLYPIEAEKPKIKWVLGENYS